MFTSNGKKIVIDLCDFTHEMFPNGLSFSETADGL